MHLYWVLNLHSILDPGLMSSQSPIQNSVILTYRDDNTGNKMREFRCTDCCKSTTLSISDLGLNADERVDLSCGCRVRLARIRERAKAGKIL